MKACPECGQRYLGNEEFCPKDGTTLKDLAAPDKDPLVGTTIDGRYTVEKKLGEGGMGVVYLATHAVIGKKCAIKVLRGELSAESEVAERFTQEARSAAAIGNEHIIEINDFGQLSDGSAYFVMEFLDGLSLQDAMKNGPKMDINRLLGILEQCCEALFAAHNADIIHRDLKPENIFLITRRGNKDFVKILDFGIAKVARESGRLTRTGVIFGTPQYMSPEQAAGTKMDVRTDIYSLGIIMYEMLTGHVPFEADTFMGVLTKHLYENPIPPRKLVPPVDVSRDLQSVLLKAIAKKPDKRYQRMSDFCEDIRALQANKPPKIVNEAMSRPTSASTLPPPSPTEIVLGRVSKREEDDDSIEQFGRQSKVKMFAGIGTGAVVILALILFFLNDSDGTEAAQEPDRAGINTLDHPVKEGDHSRPREIEPTSAPKPVEQTTQVSISSMPNGAVLFKNDILLGQLPRKVLRPRNGETAIKYSVQLEGFAQKTLLISDKTPENLTVALERLPEKKKPADTLQKAGQTEEKKRASKRERASSNREKKKPQKDRDKTKRRREKKAAISGDIADPWAN